MEPWQERVREEYNALEVKRIKLINALDHGRIPPDARQLCKAQYQIMLAYLEILTLRMEKF